MPETGGLRNAAPPSQDSVTRLPSFFIVGPPRTGTSWLHVILSRCAWLSSPTKETRFFDKHFHRGFEWYGSHYRGSAENRLIGEISPTYFASNEARERIASLIPNARVVCSFRNPVERVLSLYRLKRAYGLIPWSLAQALVCDPELMESSRYASYLKAWQSALGSDQVLVTFYEDLQRDPQSYLDTITNFVGLPRLKLAQSQTRRVLTSETMSQPRNYHLTRTAALLAEWSRARRLDGIVAAAKRMGLLQFFVGGGPAFPQLPPSDLLKLYELFRPEVDALEVMLNRDFSAWKRPSTEELNSSDPSRSQTEWQPPQLQIVDPAKIDPSLSRVDRLPLSSILKETP
jgi:hypothetical protein